MIVVVSTTGDVLNTSHFLGNVPGSKDTAEWKVLLADFDDYADRYGYPS